MVQLKFQRIATALVLYLVVSGTICVVDIPTVLVVMGSVPDSLLVGALTRKSQVAVSNPDRAIMLFHAHISIHSNFLLFNSRFRVR